MLCDLGVTGWIGTGKAGWPWSSAVQLGVARPQMGRVGGKLWESFVKSPIPPSTFMTHSLKIPAVSSRSALRAVQDQALIPGIAHGTTDLP